MSPFSSLSVSLAASAFSFYRPFHSGHKHIQAFEKKKCFFPTYPMATSGPCCSSPYISLPGLHPSLAFHRCARPSGVLAFLDFWRGLRILPVGIWLGNISVVKRVEVDCAWLVLIAGILLYELRLWSGLQQRCREKETERPSHALQPCPSSSCLFS